MNCLPSTKSRLAAAGALLAVALGCAAPALLAGERIIISNPTAAADQPLPKQTYEKSGMDYWKETMSGPGVVAPPAFMPPPPRADSGDDKRLRQQRNEKRWWLMLAPGDLQKKDAHSPSLESTTLDGRNNLSRPDDYTFYGLGNDKRLSSRDETRQSRDREARRRETEAEEEESNRDPQQARIRLGGISEFEPGGRADRGGGFWQGLLGPGQKSAPSEADMTLRDVFGDSNPSRFLSAQERQPGLRSDGPASLSGLLETAEPFKMETSWSGKAAAPAPPIINPPAMNRNREMFASPPAGANSFGSRLPSSPDPGGFQRQFSGSSSAAPLLAPSEAQKSLPTVMGGSLFNRDAPTRIAP